MFDVVLRRDTRGTSLLLPNWMERRSCALHDLILQIFDDNLTSFVKYCNAVSVVRKAEMRIKKLVTKNERITVKLKIDSEYDCPLFDII